MELKQSTREEIEAYFLLLIVPYGIETIQLEVLETKRSAFNRTLWN